MYITVKTEIPQQAQTNDHDKNGDKFWTITKIKNKKKSTQNEKNAE